MYVLQSINGFKTDSTTALTAEECRRTFYLGKKLFTALLISNSFNSEQINNFQIFLTLMGSLEKSIRARFRSAQDLAPLILMSLIRVEDLFIDFESPVVQVFKDDLINLKYTLEHYLQD